MSRPSHRRSVLVAALASTPPICAGAGLVIHLAGGGLAAASALTLLAVAALSAAGLWVVVQRVVLRPAAEEAALLVRLAQGGRIEPDDATPSAVRSVALRIDTLSCRVDALSDEAETARAEAEAAARAEARAQAEAAVARNAELQSERAQRAEAERAAAYDLACVVSACAHGDFSHRVDPNGKAGAHVDLCEGLNAMAHVAKEGLDSVRAALAELARGDLSYRMEGQYLGVFEGIANAVNKMASALDRTVAALAETGETVSSSSTRIAAAMVDLVDRTDDAASTVDAAAVTLDGLTALVERTAASTGRTRELATKAVEDVSASDATLGQTRDAIVAIQTASGDIADIVSVIDDIAFQTNLLALNAGVEAARAGEHGRGFAIVASEVRALAKRSADAAQSINDIIGRNGATIDVGVTSVARCVEALSIVDTSSRAIAEEIGAVATASERQAGEIEALKVAMEDIRATIHWAAQASRATSDATSDLDRKSHDLERLAGVFTISATRDRSASAPEALRDVG